MLKTKADNFQTKYCYYTKIDSQSDLPYLFKQVKFGVNQMHIKLSIEHNRRYMSRYTCSLPVHVKKTEHDKQVFFSYYIYIRFRNLILSSLDNSYSLSMLYLELTLF